MVRPIAVTAALAGLLIAATAFGDGPPVCGDVNASGGVNASDALLVLKAAVHQQVTLICGSGCGDGVVTEGEDCDVDVSLVETCESLGQGGGLLRCGVGCTFDTTGCFAERFDTAGDTVIDRETGLEWEKKDSLNGVGDASNVHDADNTQSWSSTGTAADGTAFTAFVSRLNGSSNGTCYASHCDWRLPTVTEWQSILVFPDCPAAPCVVDPALLPIIEDGFYWSSTTDGAQPVSAVDVDLSSGSTDLLSDKENAFHVRAVRTRGSREHFAFTGVKTNLPIASLDGWSQCYSDAYDNSGTSLESITAACPQANLMLACRSTGSATLTVVAYAPRADVLFDTGGADSPHDANGVGWYFNDDWSWGFARQGDALDLDACDLASAHPGERLCWHTIAGALDAGYRCGSAEGLDADPTHERLIFQAP